MITRSGDDCEARLDARPHGRRPPCRTGRPFRTAQNAVDQNSAGRYPLISSPMQISTRVGVVQAIGRPSLAFLNEHVKSERAGAQSRISLCSGFIGGMSANLREGMMQSRLWIG